MKSKRFIGMFEFYEKTLSGEFDSDPSCYMKQGDTEEEVKNYMDIIWQAVELDGFDNTEVLIDASFTENGEYLDHDEFVIRTEIVRTNEPSRFIKWLNKKPHIFAVDREKSRIEVLT